MENNKQDTCLMTVSELEENDIDYLSRFACLLYGVNVAGDAASRMGIDTEKSSSWIKPIFLQKYVDERHEDMKYNINKAIRGNDDEVYSW